MAKSFARIYFRNAINLGLAVLQSPTPPTPCGRATKSRSISPAAGFSPPAGSFTFFPLPESVLGIVEAGGLLEWTKKKLARP